MTEQSANIAIPDYLKISSSEGRFQRLVSTSYGGSRRPEGDGSLSLIAGSSLHQPPGQ